MKNEKDTSNSNNTMYHRGVRGAELRLKGAPILPPLVFGKGKGPQMYPAVDWVCIIPRLWWPQPYVETLNKHLTEVSGCLTYITCQNQD